MKIPGASFERRRRRVKAVERQTLATKPNVIIAPSSMNEGILAHTLGKPYMNKEIPNSVQNTCAAINERQGQK